MSPITAGAQGPIVQSIVTGEAISDVFFPEDSQTPTINTKMTAHLEYIPAKGIFFIVLAI